MEPLDTHARVTVLVVDNREAKRGAAAAFHERTRSVEHSEPGSRDKQKHGGRSCKNKNKTPTENGDPPDDDKLAVEKDDHDDGIADESYGQAKQRVFHALILVELPPNGLQPPYADKPAHSSNFAQAEGQNKACKRAQPETSRLRYLDTKVGC